MRELVKEKSISKKFIESTIVKDLEISQISVISIEKALETNSSELSRESVF